MTASSVGRMFNIAITLVTPFLKNEIQLFHNQETPDVLIVTNGGPVGCERPSTHFSATVSRLPNHKMPGSSLKDEDIFVRLCDSYQFAHRLTQNCAIDQERSQSLIHLRKLNKGIFEMEGEIRDAHKVLGKLKKKKVEMEKQLIELGVSAKEIKKIQEEIAGEGPYDPTESQMDAEAAETEYIPTEVMGAGYTPTGTVSEVTGAGYTPNEGSSLVTVQIDETLPRGLSKFLDPELMKFLSSSWSTISKAPHSGESVVISAAQTPIMSEAIQSVATQQIASEGLQASIPGMIQVLIHHSTIPAAPSMPVDPALQDSALQDSARPAASALDTVQDNADNQTKWVKLSDLFHLKDGCFHCNKCPKDFKWRTDINKHVKKCGLPPEKFACSLCNKELSSCNGLKEHMDRHSEIPDVKCDYCSTMFYNKSKQSIHYYLCLVRKQYFQDN